MALVNQPTAAPTRKKLIQDSAQFLIVLAAFLSNQIWGFAIPPGLEGLAVAVVGGWAGYMAKERV